MQEGGREGRRGGRRREKAAAAGEGRGTQKSGVTRVPGELQGGSLASLATVAGLDSRDASLEDKGLPNKFVSKRQNEAAWDRPSPAGQQMAAEKRLV